ncbi:tetratricopeptide repeat protein [Deferribacteraceae bacterium V6Fe1]|nr:tetratricopeptide repeat protein [Deferribacteraceae bacterium V6Fe1]
MYAEKLEEIKRLVKAYSGLLIKGGLEAKFEEIYKLWVSKTGNNPFKLLDLLKNNPFELREFISDITINESFFFRNAEQFECLKNLPQTPVNKKPEINILSIGCSNGCEPYSIAMYIHKNLPELFKKIKITGIDISSKIIDAAKTGIYQNWYLRHTRKEYLENYFKKVDNDYAVINEIKSKVDFLTENFLDFDTNTIYQVVFCRNFLIYFDPETIGRICLKISNLLDKDGYIIFGHSDTLMVPGNIFAKNGCRFYINTSKDSKNIQNITDIPIRMSYDLNSNQSRPKKDESEVFKKGIQFIKDAVYSEAAKEFEYLLKKINPKNLRAVTFLAYCHYRLGNLNEAQELLESIINKECMIYEPYLIYAILLFDKKRYEASLENLRKVLFINPESEIGWFYLGQVYEQINENASAINAYKRAINIIETLPETKRYPLSPEITAESLKEWITNKLSKLGY